MNHINLPEVKLGGTKNGYYLAKSLGAPFDVYLANGVEEEIDIQTGKKFTVIRDLPGLMATVVRARVFHHRKLSGDDMKFVRTAVGLKSKVLAAAIDLSPEHYSRCEAGDKTLSPTAEKLYRGYVFLATFLKDKDVHDAVKQRNSCKDELSAEDTKKAFTKFQQLFFEMKISPVCDSNEALEFVFRRRYEAQGAPCGGDDAKWNDDDLDQEAA